MKQLKRPGVHARDAQRPANSRSVSAAPAVSAAIQFGVGWFGAAGRHSAVWREAAIAERTFPVAKPGAHRVPLWLCSPVGCTGNSAVGDGRPIAEAFGVCTKKYAGTGISRDRTYALLRNRRT